MGAGITVVSDAAARSAQGATEGIQDIGGLSTTEQSKDCSKYEGKYINIRATDDTLVAFSATDTTGSSILLTSAATPTVMVPQGVPGGMAGIERVVPKGYPHLHYVAVTATSGDFAITPA